MENPFLIGERVYLRPLELSDAVQVAAWLNHPETRQYLARDAPLNQAAEEGFIAGLADRPGDEVFMIVLKDGDQGIGMIGLHGFQNSARRGTYGIAIGARDQWGKGYGPEATKLLLAYAFDERNLHRVELCVLEGNARAIKAYETLGFVHEGAKREAMLVGGEYVNELQMGLLAREWRGRPDDRRAIP